MPKIIDNIENRILLSAESLFHEKGYKNVNMKEIAEDTNIAVGTLYNYYSNKNELYLLVLEKSWNLTFKRLDEILVEDPVGFDRLLKSLIIIYDGFVERKCMGVYIRKDKDIKGEGFKDIEEDIEKYILNIFNDLSLKEEFEKDKNIKDKLIYMVLTNTTMIINMYPDDKENNIDFIYNLILPFFKKS